MDRYFIRIGDRQAGPFTKDQLRSKNITPDTEVWNEVVYDWTLASTFEQFHDLFVNAGSQPKRSFWRWW